MVCLPLIITTRGIDDDNDHHHGTLNGQTRMIANAVRQLYLACCCLLLLLLVLSINLSICLV